MIVNRVGDAALVLGMCLIYYSYNSLDYNVIFALAPYLVNDTISILNFEFYTINAIGVLLLLGAAGKSAQLFLHT
jgi:NADH-quinone oxidoreductase subunit L